MAGGKEGKFSRWVLCMVGTQHGNSLHACSSSVDTEHHNTDWQQPHVPCPTRSCLSAQIQSSLHRWSKGSASRGTIGRCNEASQGICNSCCYCIRVDGWLCPCKGGKEWEAGDLQRHLTLPHWCVFTSFYYHHHRFPTFSVKKKKGWMCHSVHFMFPSFFCIDTAGVTGFWGEALWQLQAAWNKELPSWDPQKKTTKWKILFSASWKMLDELTHPAEVTVKAWWCPAAPIMHI